MPAAPPAIFRLSDLDGRNGFRIIGDPAGLELGWDISAGDVTGDGRTDLILGAPGFSAFGPQFGAAYVLFGGINRTAPELVLGLVEAGTGRVLTGEDSFQKFGYSLSASGDVNGDGIDDVIYGIPGRGEHNHGGAAVIFGRTGTEDFDAPYSQLNGANGFRFPGQLPFDFTGEQVEILGDINGDGFADVAIASPEADPNGSRSGAVYVVYGRGSGFVPELSPAGLNLTNSLVVNGMAAFDGLGSSIAGAGDVNGDGIDDMIIGAPGVSAGTDSQGVAYVVFGQAGGFPAQLDLGSLNGANGFRIYGSERFGTLGEAVASAGDFNNDGFDDLLVGTPTADVNGAYSGAAYVVYGRASGFTSNLDLRSLSPSQGVRFDGAAEVDTVGFALSSAGDFNGDGIDDIIVGGPYAQRNGQDDVGSAFVIFGRTGGYQGPVDLSSLNGRNGFRIDGITEEGAFGHTVEGIGDFNGDGFDDIAVAAPIGDAGQSDVFVIYGRATGAINREGGAEADLLVGGDWNDVFRGLGEADTIRGNGGNDRLGGQGGNDRLVGGAGRDTLIGGNGQDTLLGNAGNDLLRGGNGDDRMRGGLGDDRLFGGPGNDAIWGGGGRDRIEGGSGRDRLAGGAGADDFVYARSGHANGDRITDFRAGVDDINLRGFMRGGEFIGSDRFTGDRGEVRYLQGTGLLQGDVDGDGRADWSLRIVNRAGLDGDDILF